MGREDGVKVWRRGGGGYLEHDDCSSVVVHCYQRDGHATQ